AAPYAPALVYPLSQTGALKYYRLTAVDVAGNQSAGAWLAAAVEYNRTVQDKFDQYGGSNVKTGVDDIYFIQLSNFEEGITSTLTSPYRGSEPGKWWAISDPTNGITELSEYSSTVIDGQYALKIYGNGNNNFAERSGLAAAITYSPSIDLTNDSRFNPDTSNVMLSIYVPTAGDLADLADITMYFYSNSIGYGKSIDVSSFAVGWNYVSFPLSDVITDSSDLSDFQEIRIIISTVSDYPTSAYVFDDLRLVSKNLNTGADHNDTGYTWDFSQSSGSTEYRQGIWHIYEGNRTGEPQKPYSLGQIKLFNNAGESHVLAYIPSTEISVGTIQVGVYAKEIGTMNYADAGVAFFIADTTPDNWTMYAVVADFYEDAIKLLMYNAGTITTLKSIPYSLNIGEMVWLGVDFRKFNSNNGLIKIFCSKNEGNLISYNNLIGTYNSTTLSGVGKVGVISSLMNCRFTNFVAGSPAHAEVADVARALDGPIVAGETKRVRFNPDTLLFEVSDDGLAWSNVDADTVDGQHASAFAPATHSHAPTDINPQGAGSGLNADRVDGFEPNTAYNDFTGLRMPVRHPSGYLYTNYLNMTANNQTATPSRVAVEQNNDGFLRWMPWSTFTSMVGASFPYIELRRTGGQIKIGKQSTAVVTWDTVVVNGGLSGWNGASRFTPPANGLYHFTFTGRANRELSPYLRRNGNWWYREIIGWSAGSTNGSYSWLGMSGLVYLTTSEWVELAIDNPSPHYDGYLHDDTAYFVIVRIL
ncbi:MAG: hypothetical protein D6784_18575, partial [Chloroflexi bacterium]